MSDIPKISIYKNAKDKTGSFTTPDEVFNYIRTGGYQIKKKEGHLLLSSAIAAVRACKSKSDRTALKIELPAVTWSGYFVKRAKDELKTHSGIICIDIDDTEIKSANAAVRLLPQLYCSFISPSGNGLKLLFKIDPDTETHEGYFRAIAEFLWDKCKLKADESGKDVSRLCFLSFDRNIYVNPNAPVLVPNDIAVSPNSEFRIPKSEIITPPAADIPKQETATLPANNEPANTQTPVPDLEWEETAARLDKIAKFTGKILLYDAGKRNKFINQFVVNCKEQGITGEVCESYSLSQFHDYKDGAKGIQSIIKSVYTNAKIVFGKRAPRVGADPRVRPSTGTNTGVGAGQKGKYNETILFWYWAEKLDKNGEPVVNPKTGEVKQTLYFDHDKITFFLANNGFKQIEIGNGFQFVRIKDSKLEPVRDQHMTAFVMEYLCQNLKTDEAGNYTEVEDELYEVRRMFKRGKKTYCSESALQSLPIFKPNFVRDTEDIAFVYFKNCFVEVTREGITTKQYSQMKGHIWSKQIIDKDFTVLDYAKDENTCVFNTFLELAVCGDVAEWEEREEKKFAAAATGIGYMCHRYKDPTNAKAVVTVDGKPRHANDSNGGSGKSLIFKAIGKVVHTCMINGKAFKFDTQYPFGTLQVDHAAAIFNDVKKNFSFEELFHYITEDWDLKRLYEDPIVIPYEDSAKVGVATNFSLQGNSDSFIRRQHIIEFSNYFNATRTPIDIFKKRFFTHWDEAEWNRFYNFMILCIRQFLKTGLAPYPLENYGINKLRDGMGDEGADWLEDNIGETTEHQFSLEVKHLKDDVYKKFKSDLPQYDKVKPNTFTGWVKEWLRIKNLFLNAHKPADGIDKSGSTYYWTFSKPVTENK